MITGELVDYHALIVIFTVIDRLEYYNNHHCITILRSENKCKFIQI